MTVLNQIFRLRTRGIFKKLKILSFSSEARHTVTRITLFQFADTTSMSVPQFKDFGTSKFLDTMGTGFLKVVPATETATVL